MSLFLVYILVMVIGMFVVLGLMLFALGSRGSSFSYIYLFLGFHIFP
jgi:hypothetical protein